MATRSIARSRPARFHRRILGPAALLAATLCLVACGGDGGEAPPSPPETVPAQPVPAPEPPATPAEPPAPTQEPAPPAAAHPVPAIDLAAGDAEAGAVHYQQYCASCHGPTGKGDGPVGAALDPTPADHSDASYMDALSDEHLFKVVKYGGTAVDRSPLMAPWGGTLSDAEIVDVIAFVRSLSGGGL